MSALGRKLWRDFRQLRGQVLAIAAVMVGGIAMMTMALSNYHALSGTRTLYYSQYRFADVFAQVRRAPLSLLPAVREIDGVREAQARVNAMARIEVPGYPEPVTGQLVSLSAPGDPGLNAVHLESGRLAEGDAEIVVGASFAQAHGLAPGGELVAIINGRRQTLRIVGIGMSPEFVYQIRPGDVFPDFERFGVMWMSREALSTAFDLDGAFNDLVLGLERGARVEDVVDALDRLLAPYGAIGAHGRELQMSHRFLDEELGQLQVMTRMFTLIFLGVAAFLLNIVLGRLVGTQREQIAVLKAFGYSRWEVGAHYAALVMLMVGAGVLPGLLLGAWMGQGMAKLYMVYFSFPFLHWTLPPVVVALACAFALAAGAIGTVGALMRAFRLSPAEAMRPEAPPVFRRTLGERIGLARWLDPAARMILRTLERRPLRSGLSVLGIGMAGGMLVMSGFQSAAIEEMVETQFGFAQRDDLAVTLVEPAGLRAVQELAALPGVRAVEPFRAAPVVLRAGHRSHRTALQGLPRDADLKRVLDRDLRPMVLPPEGLLLTDYLADMLGLSPGDRVQVDFLDGPRRQVELTLTGTVNEYLGVGAYLPREQLNRLLQEDALVSGAWLSVDPLRRDLLLSELRARPRVAGITDREAMIRGFRQTLAESILTFTLIATVLAGSIAVGVVYNAARITLAERSREFATLRVLGYTRAEVRRLLAGELATLTLLALLPGFAIGHGLSVLLAWSFQSELYRIPVAVPAQAYALAGLLLLAATLVSILLVRNRLDRLDIASALKTME